MKASFSILLGLLGCGVLAIISAGFADSAVERLVGGLLALVVYAICIMIAGGIMDEHQVSTATLTKYLVEAENPTQVREIIERALDGEKFAVKQKREGDKLFKRYYPREITLGSQNSSHQ
ncbi:hypothetical protein HF984_04965 [Rothia terrae]|uniref:hypothetical protein n=1 Tax=Rothia terrae TaxID=396015 RepID=UPI001447CECC|nr:hypothetical protein [Rothia terrae]NKZ34121.1 hypothetical protein [Rothia terrae]